MSPNFVGTISGSHSVAFMDAHLTSCGRDKKALTCSREVPQISDALPRVGGVVAAIAAAAVAAAAEPT